MATTTTREQIPTYIIKKAHSSRAIADLLIEAGFTPGQPVRIQSETTQPGSTSQVVALEPLIDGELPDIHSI